MRKILLITLIFMSAISAFGQDSTKVKEPEFVNNYCLMNTDSTFTILPKENGTIKKHQNNVSKWTKIIGNVSTVAMAAGSIVGISAGSAGAVIDGMRTVSTAASVGQVADAANVLAGAEGMDIAFDGAHSEYVIPKDMKDINIVVKGEDNSQDPMELYRIVRFNSSKKDRRIQWMQMKPAIIGTEKAEKAGYIKFTAHKFGKQSYILTIPEKEIQPGEYGIFYFSIVSSLSIPVGTFSIQK